MTLEVLNATGKTLTIKGNTYADGSWVNIVPYWAYDNLESTDNDVDGPNAGRAMDGTMIRDRVSIKMKTNFVSVPLTMEECLALKELVRPESFSVRTSIFDGTSRTYNMYSNNRVITHIVDRPDGTSICKVAFPLIEM